MSLDSANTGFGFMAFDIIDRFALLEELFDETSEVLGIDLDAYRNHAYRVFNLCRAQCAANPEAAGEPPEKIAIAAHYHDLGIWTDGTFDYLAPSTARALAYLTATGRDEWSAEISHMIMEHHKMTQHRAKNGRLVELFRRADWIDVTLGLRRYGLERSMVSEIRTVFPNAGFHRRLLALGGRRLRTHPLSPLPMLRW
jgi:hypothetical protein